MNHNQASLLSYEEVANVLKTDTTTGLTSFEARDRLKEYGQNKLDCEKSSSKTVTTFLYQEVLDFLKQFLNPLIQLLLICVIISTAIGEYENAISVGVSILIVCTISYVQETRADKSLEKLTKQVSNMCKVVRENQVVELESQYLVPGDIIFLNEGQRVPADVRLFDLHSLTLNEANLTGETQPQPKMIEPNDGKLNSVLSGKLRLEEDKYFVHQNLAMMGTIVEMGHSKGIVILTGNTTRYGQVYSMLKNTIQPRSPLQLNIDQLSLHLVVVSCSIITLMSILGIIQARPALEVAYYAISLAVTAIPEGLPVVVAVIMALGVMRLSKRKTIVKSLNSIETLGCIQVLCVDKTGTLTRNDMTLTDIVTSELHSVSGSELEELNNEECRKHMTFNKFGGKLYAIGRLMEVGTLCNNAIVDNMNLSASSELSSSTAQNGKQQYLGQPTECAILDASLRIGFGDSRSKFDRISEIPFNSVSRKMSVLCRRIDVPSNSPMYYVKGAWEDILEDCSHYYENGLVKARNDDMWMEYKRICTALGAQGLRVLALATGPSLEELSFVGLIGINNAIRDEIPSLCTDLRVKFSIDIKMITGDSKPTALAVARKLGLAGEEIKGTIREEEQTAIEERVLMSGEEIQKLLDSDFDELAKAQEINSKSVFYRVDPVQKSEIVAKLQELDKVVAMIGDGLNDVISMKKANLSLVMGSGADVCKEVADVIIVDDDLSMLTEAVTEGRGIYHKIHSFMCYQISISLSLLCLIGMSFATRTQAPFTILQLLFLNILADGPPAQSLGVEQIEADELNKTPRNVHEPILNCQLLGSLFTLTSTLVIINGTLYYLLIDGLGKLDYRACSLLFTCFVLCSVFAAISLRSKTKTLLETKILGNKELLLCCILVVTIQFIIVDVEPINDFFKVKSISVLEFFYLLLLASSVLLVMDSVKICGRVFDYMKKRVLKKCKMIEPLGKEQA